MGDPRTLKTAQELHDWLVTDVRTRSICRDFTAEFQIIGKGKLVEDDPTWDLGASLRLPTDSRTECREALKDAIRRAQRLFDLKR